MGISPLRSPPKKSLWGRLPPVLPVTATIGLYLQVLAFKG
jgi:hypothetical protein